jgi:hypothetical protein
VEKYSRAGQARDDNIIRRMRYSCWITKATDTHSEYVIRIAFRKQQLLRERGSVLRYTCIGCLVFYMLLLFAPVRFLMACNIEYDVTNKLPQTVTLVFFWRHRSLAEFPF